MIAVTLALAVLLALVALWPVDRRGERSCEQWRRERGR